MIPAERVRPDTRVRRRGELGVIAWVQLGSEFGVRWDAHPLWSPASYRFDQLDALELVEGGARDES